MLSYVFIVLTLAFAHDSHAGTNPKISSTIINTPYGPVDTSKLPLGLSGEASDETPKAANPVDPCPEMIDSHNKIVRDALNALEPYTSQLLGELYTFVTYHLSETKAPLAHNLIQRYNRLYDKISATPGLANPNEAPMQALELTRKKLKKALEASLSKMDAVDSWEWASQSLQKLPASEKKTPGINALMSALRQNLRAASGNAFDAIYAFASEGISASTLLETLQGAPRKDSKNPFAIAWSNAKVSQGHVRLERCVSLGGPNSEDPSWAHGCVSFDLTSKTTKGYAPLDAFNHPAAILQSNDFESESYGMSYEPYVSSGENSAKFLGDSYRELKNKCGKSSSFSKALPVLAPSDFDEAQRKAYL